MKKILLIIFFFIIPFVIFLYAIVYSKGHFVWGFGIDSNQNEMLIELENHLIIPMYFDDIKILSDKEDVGGKKYIYKLKENKAFAVFSAQLESNELKNMIEFYEPFTPKFLMKVGSITGVLIRDASFNNLNQIEVSFRILGILPYKFVTDID